MSDSQKPQKVEVVNTVRVDTSQLSVSTGLGLLMFLLLLTTCSVESNIREQNDLIQQQNELLERMAPPAEPEL